MKPSKITKITAKKAWFMQILPFVGLTWCGVVYVKNALYEWQINQSDGIDSVFENHELYHVRQAESTDDSWFKFYLLYLLQWIQNLPLMFINLYAPYKFMPFEMEAFRYERHKQAPSGKSERWKEMKKISLKERFKLAKTWYKYSKGTIPFGDFLKSNNVK